MDASTVDQLESYSDQLAVAVKGLRALLRTLDDAAEVNSDVDAGTAKAKASILTSVEGIRTLLDEPNEFLQRLTIQVRVLASSSSLPDFASSGFINLFSYRWRFLRASNGSLNSRFWRAFRGKSACPSVT
jgi:Tfp pilus assembly protein PilO